MLPVVGLALLSDDDSGLHRPRIRPRSFSQCGKGPARASDHTLAETRVHYKRAQPASPKATVCPCRTEGGTRLAIQLSDRGGASPPGPAAHADDRDGGTDPWAVTWGLLCPGLDVHVISAGRRAGRPAPCGRFSAVRAQYAMLHNRARSNRFGFHQSERGMHDRWDGTVYCLSVSARSESETSYTGTA